MVRFIYCKNQLIKKSGQTSPQRQIFAVNLGFLCNLSKSAHCQNMNVLHVLCFFFWKGLRYLEAAVLSDSQSPAASSSSHLSCVSFNSDLHLLMFSLLVDVMSCGMIWVKGRVLQPQQSLSSLCCFLQTSSPRSLRARTRLHGATPRGPSESWLEKLRADEFDLFNQRPGFY